MNKKNQLNPSSSQVYFQRYEIGHSHRVSDQRGGGGVVEQSGREGMRSSMSG